MKVKVNGTLDVSVEVDPIDVIESLISKYVPNRCYLGNHDGLHCIMESGGNHTDDVIREYLNDDVANYISDLIHVLDYLNVQRGLKLLKTE